MLRVIATRTDDTWGLVEEEEFLSRNVELKDIFLEFGWVKPYDENDALPPKGLNDYEPGKAYPKDRFIINMGSMYKSNVQTSTTWVAGEWDIRIRGAR